MLTGIFDQEPGTLLHLGLGGAGTFFFARPRDPGKRAAMVIGAFRATGRKSGATHRANALYHRLDSPSPSCSARAPRVSSRQTRPRSIRLWPAIVADRESTARNRPQAPNRPKRQTVAPSCRAPAMRS